MLRRTASFAVADDKFAQIAKSSDKHFVLLDKALSQTSIGVGDAAFGPHRKLIGEPVDGARVGSALESRAIVPLVQLPESGVRLWKWGTGMGI